MMRPTILNRPNHGRRGFTLVELMIALVLVLLLVLAVTQIFNVTAKAIGKGTATGEVVRGLDAARVALQIDFAGTDNIAYEGFSDKSGILPTNRQPAIIISSMSIPAFVGQRDMDADNDYAITSPWPFGLQTVDSDNNGVDDLTLTPYHLGTRWFRTDTLSFFTGGEFESQTNLQPAGGGFYGETTSREAWVWYGHGRVYNGAGPLADEGSFLLPAAATADSNPNHFFASQFVLLRTPILLKTPYDHDNLSSTAVTLTTDLGGPNEILFLRPLWNSLNPSDPAPSTEPEVGPLFYGSEVRVFDDTATDDHRQELASPTVPYMIQHSRVDVAGVTAGQYRQRLRAAQASGAANAEANRRLLFHSNSPYDASTNTWYHRLFARYDNDPQYRPQNPARFWVNPLVIKPLNAGEVSQASSYLLSGAAQFIVEYAGDFIRQDPSSGEIATVMTDGVTPAPNGGLTPDGVIDFTIDANGLRHIRWYGMPRDVNGDGIIAGPGLAPSAPGGATDPLLLQSIDVRPLADYLPQSGAMTCDTGFPFEKRLPGRYTGNPETPQSRVAIDNYITDIDWLNDVEADWTYLVAWGPGDFDGNIYSTTNTAHPYDFSSPEVPDGNLRPSLIRVIITGIDAKAKLENPISQELVFRVPHE